LPASPWELRWTSAGYFNEAFRGRCQEVAANPFRFLYNHYRSELSRRQMDGVALVNIDGKRVRRAFPG
jgi:hypothetical protein